PGGSLLVGGGVCVDHREPCVRDTRGGGSMGANRNRRRGHVVEVRLHRRLEGTLPPVGHDDHRRLSVGEVVEERTGGVRVGGSHGGIGDFVLVYQLAVEAGHLLGGLRRELRGAAVQQLSAIGQHE